LVQREFELNEACRGTPATDAGVGIVEVTTNS
jgi:hypothetical protein